MNDINKYELNTNWVLWCHSLTNNNWDLESYNKIYELENIYDYKSMIELVGLNDYYNSMFFLMRDGILPIWEDENNKNGCSLTIKVPSNKVKTEWDKLILNSITENIRLDKEDYNEITGLSISPKKEFNIIKIWLRNKVNNLNNIEKQLKLYDPYLNKKNIKIKKYN
tara:strand:+ start:721 stop:1221 length:501 start_codon:yes stop_codon:yes gene_type:complete